MLNIYVPASDRRQELIKKIAQSIEQQTTFQNVAYHKDIVADFHRKKFTIAKDLDLDTFEKLSCSESGSFIQEGLQPIENYISLGLKERTDIYLALITREAYSLDLVSFLAGYLKYKEYSAGLIENFISVFQELKNNAVMHGNLEQKIHIKSIMESDELSAEEKHDKLQEVFDNIQKALNSKKGDRAFILRLTCYDETVMLEVQDQGMGFDFEAFQEKYSDTKLTKGMDMVFLMSKDIQYDFENRTMQVVLEDPDKDAHEDLEKSANELSVTLWGDDEAEASRLEQSLKEGGIQNIDIYKGDQGVEGGHASHGDILIMLCGKSEEERLEDLRAVRALYSKTDFPIFLQKPEGNCDKLIRDAGSYVNDFINYGVQSSELISRIKAHNSMVHARRAFDGFYKHYHSEVLQSKNTIEALEKQETIAIRNKENVALGYALINGSHTVAETTDNIDILEDRGYIPYANGFSFSQRDCVYFIFISMRNGLSSILLLSYLEGCIEQIKNSSEPLTPQTLVGRFQSFIDGVIPVSFYSGVFCVCWNRTDETLTFFGSNQFSAHCYDHSEKHMLSNIGQKDYKLEPGKFWMITDSSIRLKSETLENKIEEIANHYAKRKRMVYENWMDILSPHGTRIPYLILCPLQESA